MINVQKGKDGGWLIGTERIVPNAAWGGGIRVSISFN